MDVILFLTFAVIAVVCAINVVVQTHPISSALSLVGVMGSLAVLYLLLGAEFIAAAQVIVYAGAIMVLFVFVIMLVNLDVALHQVQFNRHWLVAALLALVLGAEVAAALVVSRRGPLGLASAQPAAARIVTAVPCTAAAPTSGRGSTPTMTAPAAWPMTPASTPTWPANR